jgi:hypothetical protein
MNSFPVLPPKFGQHCRANGTNVHPFHRCIFSLFLGKANKAVAFSPHAFPLYNFVAGFHCNKGRKYPSEMVEKNWKKSFKT